MEWYTPPSQTKDATIVTLGNNQGVFVAPNITINSRTAPTLLGTGDQHYALVRGTVIASDLTSNAIMFGDNPTNDSLNRVEVSSSGLVQGLAFSNAVFLRGHSSSIFNEGTISATEAAGIVLRGSSKTTTSEVINDGIIEGSVAITRFGVDAIGEKIYVENTGIIRGSTASYGLFASEGGAALDYIHNDGKMIGKISLYSGDDFYDGRGGTVKGNVYGGAGDDRIYGGKENNTFFGDAGNDKFYGGNGADTMTGGGAVDTFIFKNISESTVAPEGRDVIKDFSSIDIIHLEGIDARSDKGGNQAFHFIETDQFSKHAGELRYEKKSGDTYIQADTNGDGSADFFITLDPSVTLNVGDFVL